MTKKKKYDLSLAVLGTEWAAAVIGFTLLGLWIDRRWETEPWAVLICLGIGFVGGTYNFVKAAQRAARESAARAAEGGRKDDEEAGA